MHDASAVRHTVVRGKIEASHGGPREWFVIGTDLATGKIGSEATYKVCVSKKR